ncbi:hypothetical protein NL676_001432 [Syzygium grande]|nr:hypothetical protein NL676_001432 [Syzygium grande]
MEDYGGQSQYEEDNPFAFDGEEEIYVDQQLPQYQHQHQHQQQQQQTERRYVGREVDSFSGGDGEETDRRRPVEHRDSSSRKLFVGGISWETTEDRFTNYFSKYGEIADSVIMTDKYSGRPRGFGFVTFADSSVADKILRNATFLGCCIMSGRLPAFLSEVEEYFSFYGGIVEHQIMLDHTTGRSRGFGFVTFAEEDAVERIISEGRVHELGGKQVWHHEGPVPEDDPSNSFDRKRTKSASFTSLSSVQQRLNYGGPPDFPQRSGLNVYAKSSAMPETTLRSSATTSVGLLLRCTPTVCRNS